jgi:hypothetical protein
MDEQWSGILVHPEVAEASCHAYHRAFFCVSVYNKAVRVSAVQCMVGIKENAVLRRRRTEGTYAVGKQLRLRPISGLH